MGTRADFYIGRGENAEWLGSIAWDGDEVFADLTAPDAYRPEEYIEQSIADEQIYRDEIAKFLANRDDATVPTQGWPWPWDDSNTTDVAYTFDDGAVMIFSHRGWETIQGYFDGNESECEREAAGEDIPYNPVYGKFPNMKDRQNVRWDAGSGLIVL